MEHTKQFYTKQFEKYKAFARSYGIEPMLTNVTEFSGAYDSFAHDIKAGAIKKRGGSVAETIANVEWKPTDFRTAKAFRNALKEAGGPVLLIKDIQFMEHQEFVTVYAPEIKKYNEMLREKYKVDDPTLSRAERTRAKELMRKDMGMHWFGSP